MPKEGEGRDEQTLGAAKPKLRNRFYFFSYELEVSPETKVSRVPNLEGNLVKNIGRWKRDGYARWQLQSFAREGENSMVPKIRCRFPRPATIRVSGAVLC